MKGENVHELKVDLGLESYSKATLIDLVRLYSKLYITLDGFWYLSAKNEFGNDTALRHDIWVWEKMNKREVNALLETLQIQARDIASFFKVLTLTPWMPQLDYEVDIKDAHHGILTIHHCPTLIALEKEGEGREKEICTIVDLGYFKRCAALFNPHLEAFPIDLPPRKNRDGFCCQWVFVLME